MFRLDWLHGGEHHVLDAKAFASFLELPLCNPKWRVQPFIDYFLNTVKVVDEGFADFAGALGKEPLSWRGHRGQASIFFLTCLDHIVYVHQTQNILVVDG